MKYLPLAAFILGSALLVGALFLLVASTAHAGVIPRDCGHVDVEEAPPEAVEALENLGYISTPTDSAERLYAPCDAARNNADRTGAKLREEISALRSEVAAMRSEVRSLRGAVEAVRGWGEALASALMNPGGANQTGGEGERGSGV